MSAFTGPLRLEHMGTKWRLWKLLEDLIWEVDAEGSGKVIVVPAGFVTDGASIPRLLWALLPPTGGYLRAACLHDRLLRLIAEGTPDLYVPTRAIADRQFRLACRACGTGWLTSMILYAGVRIGALLAHVRG